MRSPVLALLCALVLTVPARAAAGDDDDDELPPPPSEVAAYQVMSQRTQLDLSGIWEDYIDDRDEGDTFTSFAIRKIRRKRGTGIGLTCAGLTLTIVGAAVIADAAAGAGSDEDIAYLAGGFFALGGVALLVPGAVLWGINQSRLGTLNQAGYRADAGLNLQVGRARLRAAGPIALPRGAGLGLSFSF